MCACRHVARRSFTYLCLQLMLGLGDHIAIELNLLPIGGLQLLDYLVRRLGEEAQEMLPRNVGAQPNTKSQLGVTVGSRCKGRTTKFGKPCSGVGRDTDDNLLVAALDNDVGH